MADIDVLKGKLNDIGEAIRSKTAQVELLSLDEMPDAIRSISGGGGLPSQTKTVTPTAEGLVVNPDSGYTLSRVTVNGDSDLTPSNVKSGVEIFGVQGELEPALPTQEKSVMPTKNGTVVTPDEGFTLSKVSVDGDARFIPANIRNGLTIFDVQGTLVPAKIEQEKTTDPSTSTVEVTPDTNKVLSKVTVNPIPTETKTVTDLDLSSGIGMISPTSGKFMSQVMIPRPAGLSAENIKEGVSIFGILGTLAGGGGGLPSIIDKVDAGSFVVPAKTNSAQVINHNLGAIPDLWVAWAEITSQAEYERFIESTSSIVNGIVGGIYIRNLYFRASSSSQRPDFTTSFVGAFVNGVTSSIVSSTYLVEPTATQLTIWKSSGSYYFKPGFTYKWVAVKFK